MRTARLIKFTVLLPATVTNDRLAEATEEFFRRTVEGLGGELTNHDVESLDDSLDEPDEPDDQTRYTITCDPEGQWVVWRGHRIAGKFPTAAEAIDYQRSKE